MRLEDVNIAPKRKPCPNAVNVICYASPEIGCRIVVVFRTFGQSRFQSGV